MAKYLSHLIRAGAKDDMMYDGWCSWEFAPAVQTNYSAEACTYNRFRTHWCVPFGVTCAMFEIWGGGGSGAGNCNCSFATPSGSGGYAKKTIKVKGGQCYYMSVGYHWCCISESGINQRHCGSNRDRNRDTFVIGEGLTNFCAEVGFGGVSFCCVGKQFDSSGAPAYGMTGYKTVGAGSATRGVAFTGDSAVYFCQYQGLDSGCARAYGGDENYHGLPGWIQLPADSNFTFTAATTPMTSKPCGYKQGVPYPGGVFGCKAGHVVMYTCSADGLGGEEVTNKGPMAAGIHCVKYPYHISAGWGVSGGWTHSTNCCCSGPSMSGKVRVTYK